MATRKKATTAVETEEIVVEKRYTKEVILSMKKYRQYRDLLSIVLEDKKYATDEVDKKLERVLKTVIK